MISPPSPPGEVVATRRRRIDPRLAAPALGAWAATAGGTLLSPLTNVTGAVVSAAVVVVLFLARRLSVVALLALGLSLGAASAAWHVHHLRAGLLPRLAAQRADVDVMARLVRDPVAVTTVSGTPLTITDATVTSVLDNGWHGASSPVLVLSYGSGWLGLLPGQRVELTGRVAPPRRGDDVSAVLDARGPPVLLGRPPWWQRAAGRVRTGLRAACAGLPADERGLLAGLVDGDTSAVPASVQNDMRITGLTHLEAVSGENVSVVLAVALGVARSLGLLRRARVVLASFALLAFVVLARPSPSVLRAAVMGSVVLLGLLSGRRISAVPALSASVLVLVCVNPFLARSVGFVLSVCATFAILTFAPVWARRLARHLPKPLATAIAVPAAAQVACTPVLVLAFGQLSPYAIPANLMAAPAVPPATICGVVAAVLAALSVRLAVPLVWLAALPTAWIAVVARSLSGLPGAGLRWPGAWPVIVVLGVALATVILRRRMRRPFVTPGRRPPARDILGGWPP